MMIQELEETNKKMRSEGSKKGKKIAKEGDRWKKEMCIRDSVSGVSYKNGRIAAIIICCKVTSVG